MTEVWWHRAGWVFPHPVFSMEIEDLLQRYGIEYRTAGSHHHSRPGWIQIDCPFCGPGSHRFHLGINLQRLYFHCWKCGPHRRWEVWKSLGIPPSEVPDVILETPKAEPRQNRVLKEPPGRGPLLPAHRKYLRSRGLDPDEVVRIWHVEGLGIVPRLAWRLYIPIYYRGERVSWTTRAIGSSPQLLRYLSASRQEEKIPHKHLVYGIDFCRNSIIVVEGPVDVWRIGPGAGALFGTAFTMSQVAKIARFPYRIVCFDSEPTAQRKAEELCELLSVFPGKTLRVQLDAKDPGSASESELRRLRRMAGL